MAMNKDDGELLADRVNNFLSSNRKVILGVIATLLVVVVGLTVYFSFVAKKKADDVASIEKIIFDLNKAKEDIEKEKEEAKKKEEEKKKEDEGNTASYLSGDVDKSESEEENSITKEDENDEEEPTDPKVLEKEDEIIPKLAELGMNAKGYASYLAFYNIADIYFARKDYTKAKDYYSKAVDAVPNSYVLGVLYFNIAVCMEELKESDDAILEYYKKSSEVEEFPLKPRAMFNMARVQEKMGKKNEAIATYQEILENYPDNDFAFMGKTRIIDLEINK